MRFLIGIVGLDGRAPHAMCFFDFARALANALRTLGHEVEYANPGVRPGRYLLFGANNLSDDPANPKIPEDAIVYNAEQLASVRDPRYFLQNWAQYRKSGVIWDYAQSNVEALAKIDVRAIHCPVGYEPSMTHIERADEDIDVLFYGSIVGRRRQVLDRLDEAGLRVVRPDRVFEGRKPFGVYGPELDRLIARAKVVLNLHYYDHGVFEIFRCSHLLANRKCVVTEGGGRDDALEALAKETCAYVPYESVVEECRRLVADASARQAQTECGHEMFKRVSLVENVKRALERS